MYFKPRLRLKRKAPYVCANVGVHMLFKCSIRHSGVFLLYQIHVTLDHDLMSFQKNVAGLKYRLKLLVTAEGFLYFEMGRIGDQVKFSVSYAHPLNCFFCLFVGNLIDSNGKTQ